MKESELEFEKLRIRSRKFYVPTHSPTIKYVLITECVSSGNFDENIQCDRLTYT
jgi:hypothetical protein